MTVLKRGTLLCSLLLASLLLVDCERDDICAEETPTTPLLIIKFFDDITRTDEKDAPNLRVRSTDEGAEAFIDLTTTDSIMIPLKTDGLITEYEFAINSGEDDENIDILNFQYITEEEFVSSACGFRVLYRGLTESGVGGTDENWIEEISVQQLDVIDETVTHVYIYH